MRVLILVLLLVYTILPAGIYTLLKRYNAYFHVKDVSFKNGSLILRSTGFGFNGLFGKNFSFYAEELSVGREIKAKSIFVNLINLRRKKKELLS